MLDGKVWAVVRPIGHGRRDLPVEGGDLDALAAGTEPAPGLDAFLDAVEERLITAPVAALVPGGHPHRAWLSALAWLARDQECRFDHVLAWRSAASGSDSPVRDRDLGQQDRLDALRAFLGTITPEDLETRGLAAGVAAKQKAADQEARHFGWQADRLRASLIEAQRLREDEVPPGRLGRAPATGHPGRQGRAGHRSGRSR